MIQTNRSQINPICTLNEKFDGNLHSKQRVFHWNMNTKTQEAVQTSVAEVESKEEDTGPIITMGLL